MKLKSVLLAATLAAFAASTQTVLAADEHPADTKAEKTEAAKTETGEAAKPAKKKVKQHSHAEKKLGMPMPEPAGGKSHRETMDKDMPMHDHTQDKH